MYCYFESISILFLLNNPSWSFYRLLNRDEAFRGDIVAEIWNKLVLVTFPKLVTASGRGASACSKWRCYSFRGEFWVFNRFGDIEECNFGDFNVYLLGDLEVLGFTTFYDFWILGDFYLVTVGGNFWGLTLSF